ncbi:MAG: HAMP domain-containing protein [Hyphomicrobiales bacterium]|nr:HAMP domain-containing protein [Hyphomicrobiales bacterium]
MTTAVETGAPPRRGVRAAYRRFARRLGSAMPKGLYARSLIIIITPVVVIQTVVAFVFMEQHWQTVTERLTAAVVADIAAIIDVLETYPQDADFDEITRIARKRLNLRIAVRPPGPLPVAGPKPFFSQLDRNFSKEITKQIGRPFWIDTVGRSNLVEIRIQLNDNVLRVFARRSQTYASNSFTFLSLMVGISVILLTIAIIFLRNQIRPILRLAAAVDDFGKGRTVPDFAPRGAREVRRATSAFHEMRERVDRQIEQRTAMLAGVSHDLRTILTRFRLQLALIEDRAEVGALVKDVDDMNRMLEGYLAFARGDAGEEAIPTDVDMLLREIGNETRVSGHEAKIAFSGDPIVKVRPQGFKRCLTNLVRNAARHGDRVTVTATHEDGQLVVYVDDDGPGVPPDERDTVFKPFYRGDIARNIDESGTGLGLAIARDLARSHGGDITLDLSPLGGLRATVVIPA